jgi:hypothetical protein
MPGAILIGQRFGGTHLRTNGLGCLLAEKPSLSLFIFISLCRRREMKMKREREGCSKRERIGNFRVFIC